MDFWTRLNNLITASEVVIDRFHNSNYHMSAIIVRRTA